MRGFSVRGKISFRENEIIVRGEHPALRIVLPNENNKGVLSEGRELAHPRKLEGKGGRFDWP